MAGNLVPRTDGGADLGTASKEWDKLYAKDLGGTVAGKIAPKASPAFTGTPTAPTAAVGTSTTQIATTKFVVDEIADNLAGSIVPGTDGTASLGSASKEYNKVYAKELGGTVADLVAMKDTSKRGTAYSAGDTVKMPGLPADMYLECTTAGTTASTAPVISSPTVDGTVSDGTVTWTIRKAVNTSNLIMSIDVFLRQPSTAYAVGAVVYLPAMGAAMFLECTTAGTSGSGDLTISTPTPGDTVSDGAVVWTIRKSNFDPNALTREVTPAFNTRDIITTSGTYTAPVTGWYKVTAKGGGGGGGGGWLSGIYYGGGGGGEGGTTIAYISMTAGDTATVVVGAGGSGGAGSVNGSSGGNTSVTYNGNTHTAEGGSGGYYLRSGGLGGDGTIKGCAGNSGDVLDSGNGNGGSGGGAGGGIYNATAGQTGGGGAGGYPSIKNGGNGGDGFVWFEYFATI